MAGKNRCCFVAQATETSLEGIATAAQPAIMIRAKPTIVELDMGELDEVLRRAASKLDAEDYALLKTLAESYTYLTELVGDKNTSIHRLRKLLFGGKTEKTTTVVGHHPQNDRGRAPEVAAALQVDSPLAASDNVDDLARVAAETAADAEQESDSPTPVSGHGRNGAEAYTGAERIEVPHSSLQAGDSCPQCENGTVYGTGRPGVLLRLVGQAPVGARVYYLEKLRCNLCGVVFTAEPPASAGDEKHDATVGSMIALLKYGAGMPFHRAEKLQESLGIPLPASTQWDIVEAQAERAEPVFDELIRQAAQGDVVHNDDTTIKILELMGERAKQEALAEDAAEGTENKLTQRSGTFTSGIVSTREGRWIALFFSGRQHAGENLQDVLRQRASELAPPIQMCDALSRNLPAELATIVANCLAHARRQFVEVADRFPAECRHVLEDLAVIYKHDAVARSRELSPQARLELHQAQSGPIMEELHAWLVRQFDERLVEPNSALGGAISYLLRHWEQLTLFLRQPGAPLDNNICERALKKSIQHRKNALFYKTRHGARVGDLLMSLIYTCELSRANPFDYLTELERHADDARANPQHWLPWNYRQTLDGTVTPAGTAN
jgi:transposase